MDELLKDLPAHFEASRIHIAGLVTASYSGEDFSHYLATSSLGTWLKEQGVPAIYGVDTRALTKRIRKHGSMLGRMLVQRNDLPNGYANGLSNGAIARASSKDWRPLFESIDWVNPNEKNLVADGESWLVLGSFTELTSSNSVNTKTQIIFSQTIQCP